VHYRAHFESAKPPGTGYGKLLTDDRGRDWRVHHDAKARVAHATRHGETYSFSTAAGRWGTKMTKIKHRPYPLYPYRVGRSWA